MSVEVFGLPIIIHESMAILIPVLIFIGKALKDGRKVMDEDIPLTLGILGAGFGIVITIVATTFTIEAALNGFFQGIGCAAVAVYGNQLKRQRDKKDVIR